MHDNLLEIDLAMNMIKEDIIKDLSESVSNQNKSNLFDKASSTSFSFCENNKD